MRTLLQDLRYGARMVRTQPGFSAVVVMTLALAIGANTVIFSFANVLLVRPLPLADQETLGWIFTIDPQTGGARGPLSIPEFLDYRRSLKSFQAIGATVRSSATLTGRGEAERLTASRVTANLFDMWGLRLVAGRGFSHGADEPGRPKEVVLSHHYWVNRMDGDRAIIGTSLTLDGAPATIVGVLAPDIEFGNLAAIDLWIPLELSPSAARADRILRVSGRLAPGATVAQASTEVRQVAQVLARDHAPSNAGWSARVVPTREAMTGTDTWLVLALLSVVVVFVLLIACANLANLVLARASARRRELAVRIALGASRGRVIRQMLTENLLYGVLGGAMGLAVAYAGMAAIKAVAYEAFFELVRIDRNVLMFTAVLALVTPMLFSLLPALQSSRTDVNDALKDGGRTMGSAGAGRSRSILVVAQLALAVMLLVLSTLLLQALVKIAAAPPGFDAGRLLTLQLDLPAWRYTNDAALTDYGERLVARLGAIPGVDAAATTNRLPLLGSEAPAIVAIDGQAAARPEDRPWAVPSVVSDDYFETAGISMVAGRGFLERDNASGAPVAIVSREMARRFWGAPERAVGARLSLDAREGAARRYEVIGVSADVLRGDREGVNPEIYFAARQQPQRSMQVMVRATDPAAVMAAVRDEVRAVDRDVPVSAMRTMQNAVDEDLSSSKVLGGLFVAFAIVALVLAAAGLYAVVAYGVSQRTQEFGVRIALGAVPRDIRVMMLRQTGMLVVVGVAIGLAGGRALAVGAASLLYRVSPSDPATYLGVAATLSVVALVATYVPVRRATRIDPIRALRLE